MGTFNFYRFAKAKSQHSISSRTVDQFKKDTQWDKLTQSEQTAWKNKLSEAVFNKIKWEIEHSKNPDVDSSLKKTAAGLSQSEITQVTNEFVRELVCELLTSSDCKIKNPKLRKNFEAYCEGV